MTQIGTRKTVKRFAIFPKEIGRFNSFITDDGFTHGAHVRIFHDDYTTVWLKKYTEEFVWVNEINTNSIFNHKEEQWILLNRKL